MRKQKIIESDVGKLYLIASEKGLQGIFWKKQKIENTKGKNVFVDEIFFETEKQIKEYFSGKRKKFNLKFDLIGTDFQKRVWMELTKIEYGQTKSYKEIATILGDPNASRAVGSANGKNPLSIVIACHRVINLNGNLGGYAGGIKVKEKLLKLEGAKFNRIKK